MTFTDYKSTLSNTSAPKGISPELEALWHDGKGDWNASHEVIQDVNTKNAAWVHAYLHRKEGDLGNARYWYSRAGKSMPDMSLEEEWKLLVENFLN